MNVCIFGDSLTWGASDYEKGGWAERLKMHCLKNTDDTHVFNLGMPGDNSQTLLKRFETKAAARNPSVIIFAIGLNDSQYIKKREKYRVNLDRFKLNLSELIKLARGIADEVIFLGLTRVDETKTRPIFWDPDKNYDNESIEKYDLTIKKICEEEQLFYVEMNKTIELSDLEDGLHPNSHGHEKIFRTILEKLKLF